MDGIICRKCKSHKSIVLESRVIDQLRVRTRQCQKCGYRWKTVEVNYWDYIHGRTKLC